MKKAIKKPTKKPIKQIELCSPRKTLLSIAMLSAIYGPVSAQESSLAIEEIIVTATRRSENMQDVPIAVQVMSTEMIDQLEVAHAARMKFDVQLAKLRGEILDQTFESIDLNVVLPDGGI